ncbi:MAG: hypothetical protein ABR985_17475 [Methanotrichaceae archaeon]
MICFTFARPFPGLIFSKPAIPNYGLRSPPDHLPLPQVLLQCPGSPNEMFAKALNRNLNLQRFKVLYICGNYSSVLSRLDRRFQDLEIRRAFTVFQLMTILEESRHSLIVIEHNPMLYEDAQGMVEYVSQGLHDAAKEAAVLLYSPGTDTFLEDMTRNADRDFDMGPV